MLAVAFAEGPAEAVADALDSARLHAPSLLAVELANAVTTRCRREPQHATAYAHALHRMLDGPVTLHRVDPFEVFALALRRNVTAYDAAYLWLSNRLECDLLTLDRRLADAARAARH
jgi:predicted nucleic acid-binding protein